MYEKMIEIKTGETTGVLYITDNAENARRLKKQGHAVVPYFHMGNRNQDFSEFLFGVEDAEELEADCVEKIYRRLRNLPWKILETDRCIVRETTVEDVDQFWEIYREPAITRYTESLYPEIEQEKQYVREYIEKIYSYYEYGVWTVMEKESGRVIGRAGFSVRPGFDNPELGFVIGVPWQRKGYAYEVCSAILKYGWEQLGFSEVQAIVAPENEASMMLCEKLGFMMEESTCAQTMIDGKEYYLLKVRQQGEFSAV